MYVKVNGKIKSCDIKKIPTVFLNYFVNGDETGLSKEDIESIRKFEEQYKFVSEVDTELPTYFTWCPDVIGLGCDVVDCYCVKR